MSNPDAAPQVHQPLDVQIEIARLNLSEISGALWSAVGYNRDILGEAQEAFPAPAQRRSDTPFTCDPTQEIELRKHAARLGPGRLQTESLEDLGVYTVDAEIIETGQLHKTVTELWRALQSGHQAPLLVLASDRTITEWAKGKEDVQLDAEQVSTHRLLTVGGQDLREGTGFFYRSGRFDEANSGVEIGSPEYRARIDAALAQPQTEYSVTEAFLQGAVDVKHDEVFPIGYDPLTGELSSEKTGQVRRLGSIAGRDIVLIHRDERPDGEKIQTSVSMALLADIASAYVQTDKSVVGYWSSHTYKPSRQMSAIRASIKASEAGLERTIVVPTYGVADLSKIKGEPKPTQPTIQNIAGELGKAAEEAIKLREYITSLTV